MKYRLERLEGQFYHWTGRDPRFETCAMGYDPSALPRTKPGDNSVASREPTQSPNPVACLKSGAAFSTRCHNAAVVSSKKP